jgi:Protein of unknown function (DUF2510)
MANDGTPPAGWHPDPTGRNELRYWDGTAWTDNASTAGQQRTDPVVGPPGSMATGGPPTATYAATNVATATAPITLYRVCPHCRVQSQTAAASCPNCGKSFAVRKKWPWVVGAIALVMVVGFVGCVALVGTAINEVGKSLSAEQARHAISKTQYDAVTIGTSRADVINQLGKEPQNAQEFENKGVLQDKITSGCIYYNRRGGGFGDAFQFCFTNGTLSSKASY